MINSPIRDFDEEKGLDMSPPSRRVEIVKGLQASIPRISQVSPRSNPANSTSYLSVFLPYFVHIPYIGVSIR